jgi:peptide/nickel transport system substrate-binding protein
VSKIFLSLIVWLSLALSACGGDTPLNDPYPESERLQSILYTSFSERPKHLDPAVSYSSNEYALIGQIYEPPFQYHYLKRPYILEPLSADAMPEIVYFDVKGQQLADNAAVADIAYTDYVLEIQPGILYQPHPALAKDKTGRYLYHQLTAQQLSNIESLADFAETGTRELVADDYVYQIKRLVNPRIHSPIAELMKQHIVGLDALAKKLADHEDLDLQKLPIDGVKVLGRYRYRIRINGKYPQFIFWLAMPFFAPMPWEADVFYAQQGLQERNISLDWYPVGTGPYMLQENNPNRRMVLVKNPNFHAEYYPDEGETKDKQEGLLDDAGKQLPFIEKVVYVLEKETIPYWNKFLQGYYDASGIASDSFDQAIQFTGEGGVQLTPAMEQKGIKLQTAVTTSIFYMGFNMLDPMVGGETEQARKLRQAIAIAVDYEEYISIFMNGRGVAAQGLLPPGIYGYTEGEAGINPYVYNWEDELLQRKQLQEAKQLMTEAGYKDGLDPKTGTALILYLDTAASGPDERARLNWYRKQFAKLGIQLVIRATDYNRFQQKMRAGNAQIFMWGWNADYPDPENFFFLLYGPNAKVANGGENAVNYQNNTFDRLFEQMRNMDNGEQRYQIIQELQEIIRHDAPWVFGFHPKSFSLFHSWYHNLKPNLMANNRLKYTKIDVQQRTAKRAQWNRPLFWPVILAVLLFIAVLLPAITAYRRRTREVIQ